MQDITIKKFDPLAVSGKYAICGMPIRVDTYKTCGFGCKYCFSNCRAIMGHPDELQVGDLAKVERRLDRVLGKGIYERTIFLDTLIADGYTWHMGGMSDPLQPIEQQHHITRDLIEIANQYGVHILISTKSDTVYDCDIRPDLHTFQLSITNTDNRTDLEPGVPSIERRRKFFDELKGMGCKVGVRIQPFIPGITSLDIVEMFHDADQITIEGIKLVPQNAAHKETVLELCNLQREDFVQKGLLSLRPEERLKMYEPFIQRMEELHIPYSIADNDLRYLGTNVCCCGDRLVHKPTNFNTTAMCMKYGCGYSLDSLKNELEAAGVCDCNCRSLYASNRVGGLRTVSEFAEDRFACPASPSNPNFQYCP